MNNGISYKVLLSFLLPLLVTFAIMELGWVHASMQSTQDQLETALQTQHDQTAWINENKDRIVSLEQRMDKAEQSIEYGHREHDALHEQVSNQQMDINSIEREVDEHQNWIHARQK